MDLTNMEGVEGDAPLIEAVAKAIYEADDPWSSAFEWPNMGSKEQSADNYRWIAKAAITALRSRHLLTPEAIEQLKKEGL